MKKLPIVNSCQQPWEEMEGGQRVRHCVQCNRPVHNLSAMSEIEARAHLLFFGAPELCVRYIADADGQLLHAPERFPRRRASVIPAPSTLAAGLLAAAISLTAAESTFAADGSAASPAELRPRPVVVPTADPSPATSPPAASGDQDGDGIPDVQDSCPMEPGPASVNPSQNGCPQPRKFVHVEKLGSVAVSPIVEFARRAAAVQPRDRPLIEEVASVLLAHPDIKKVAVYGHAATDEPHAKELGEARAKAVVAALVAAKIAPERLVVASYGTDRPRASNATKQGRDRNRRVDFVIFERGE